MFVSLVPGSLAFLSIAWLVVESAHEPRRAAFHLGAELAGTGRPFRRYLVGILAFGAGDFSRTLLILYATQHITGVLLSLRGAAAAVALYVLHNAVSAGAAFPIGALADRVGHRRVIVGGYLLAAATTLAFAVTPPTPSWLLLLFVCSGVYMASEEVAEKPTRPRSWRQTGAVPGWVCSPRATVSVTWCRAPSWDRPGPRCRARPGASPRPSSRRQGLS
jgi:Na+/melibiose symporter-like transporter